MIKTNLHNGVMKPTLSQIAALYRLYTGDSVNDYQQSWEILIRMIPIDKLQENIDLMDNAGRFPVADQYPLMFTPNFS